MSETDGRRTSRDKRKEEMVGTAVTASALPAGAATSANQSVGNNSLSSIDGKLPALSGGRVPVDGSGVTQPVSAASLPLPTGAATSALQTTGNTSLSEIAARLGAQMQTSFGQASVAEERCVIWSNFGAVILNRLWRTTGSTGTGTVTISNGRALVAAGTNGTAELRSNRAIRYVPGQGVVMRLTAPMPAITAAAGKVWIGLGDLTNGFGIGRDKTLGIFSWYANNGSVTYRYRGTDWLDKADGTGTLPSINWEYGTPISLRFRWLGYGGYQVEIEVPGVGWILADRLSYSNTSAETWSRNPSFEAFVMATNTTGAGDATILCPSIGVFTEGPNDLLGVLRGDDFLLSLGAAAGTFVPLISFRCEATLNGVTNRSRLVLASVSVFNESGTGGVRALVLRNPTLGGGGTAWTAMSAAQSIVAVDTGSTTVTYAVTDILQPFGVGANGSQRIDLLQYAHQLAPGDIVTLAVARTAGGAAFNVYGGLNVIEQL